MNLIDFINDYENGDIGEDRLIDGFQHLLDTGAINHLQGSYQRMAYYLIEQGLITFTKETK